MYRWKRPSCITDTHGCGAALAGGMLFDLTIFCQYTDVLGFLAYLALGKPIDQCVNAGLYCAYEILQRIGTQFPEKQTFNNEMVYYKTDAED